MLTPNVKFEDVNAYDDMAKNDYVIKSDAANTVVTPILMSWLRGRGQD